MFFQTEEEELINGDVQEARPSWVEESLKMKFFDPEKLIQHAQSYAKSKCFTTNISCVYTSVGENSGTTIQEKLEQRHLLCLKHFSSNVTKCPPP